MESKSNTNYDPQTNETKIINQRLKNLMKMFIFALKKKFESNTT